MDGESEPLLPQNNTPSDEQDRRYALSRRRVTVLLDSRSLHKAIIALIVVDAICVLADLSYTFLNDSCTLPGEVVEEDPMWLEVLSHISLVITTFFLIEIPLTIYGFGWRYYNPIGNVPHSKLHLFDAFIILTTFILEVVLRGRERELAGLLIILRLWRLVKLVGGIAVGAGEFTEEIEKRLAEVEIQLRETREQLQHALEENETLRSREATTS